MTFDEFTFSSKQKENEQTLQPNQTSNRSERTVPPPTAENGREIQKGHTRGVGAMVIVNVRAPTKMATGGILHLINRAKVNARLAIVKS